MPDLTIVSVPTCYSNIFWSKLIEGSGGKMYVVTWSRVNSQEYQYGWHCECKGFEFRGNCRHVKEAEKLRCAWNITMELVSVENNTCPKCGSKVEYIQTGV